MTLAEFRKLTENMDGELELAMLGEDCMYYVPVTEVKHTNELTFGRKNNKFFLALE